MAKRRPRNEVFYYRLADGRTVPVETSPAVVRSLRNAERRERTGRRDDKRFLDASGYVEGETELLLHDLGENLWECVERRQRCALMNRAIERLKARQRSYIHAYYFKGLSLQEIADLEGLNRATVGRILQKALARLQDSLLDCAELYGYEGVWPDDR